MNLVQLANDLEFVPKEQLAQMSQDPNTSYPPYLVLAEIQRRTQNEKAYAAAQPQPTSTVAEEVVGEFMQPQGMQAGMPPESAPTDVFSSGMSGMPASAPMQMANGGLTGYANRGKTKVGPPKPISPKSVLKETQDEIKNVSRRTQTFSPKYDLAEKLYMKGIIDEETYRKALQTETDTLILGSELGAFSPEWGRGKDIYRSNDSLQAARDASRNEMRQRQMGMAGGGLTAYANGGSLEQSFSDPMRQAMLAQLGFPSGMTNEQLDAAIIEQKRMSDISSGSNAPKTAGDLGEGLMQFAFGDARPDSETPIRSRMTDEFTDYLNVIPGAGGLALAGKATIKTGRAAVKKGLQKLGDRARRKDPTLMGNPTTSQIKSSADIGKNVATDAIKKTKSTLFGSVPRAATTTYGAGMVGQGISNLASQGETVNQSDPFYKQNEDGTFTNTYTEELNADLAAKQKAITDEANAKERLRIEAIEKAERKDRGYDLAQLGGLIMGSKSLGDLGMGIAGMAQQKQTRADTLKSEASKDAYYRASANKIQAEIDALPLEKTQSLLDSVLKVLENEDGLLTEEQIINYGIYRDNLQLKLLKSEGIDLSATGINALDAARI